MDPHTHSWSTTQLRGWMMDVLVDLSFHVRALIRLTRKGLSSVGACETASLLPQMPQIFMIDDADPAARARPRVPGRSESDARGAAFSKTASVRTPQGAGPEPQRRPQARSGAQGVQRSREPSEARRPEAAAKTTEDGFKTTTAEFGPPPPSPNRRDETLSDRRL